MCHNLMFRRFFSVPRAPPIAAKEFRERRAELLDLVASCADETSGRSPIVLLFSKRKTFSAPEVPHNFRQCSNFRYLSGFDLAETARLVFDQRESVIFRQERDSNQILWLTLLDFISVLGFAIIVVVFREGPMMKEEEIQNLSAVDRVLPLEEFESYFASKLKTDSVVALDMDTLELESNFDSDLRKCIQVFQGVSQKVPLSKQINKLRWIKSPAEVGIMRETCKIGSESLNAIISRAGTATNESHIVGMLEYEARRRGAQFLAYPPVVAAGKNANTIHYISANQNMKKSDCLLVDAGCDLQGYVSDITRCFPLSGQFSTTNRMLYDALNFVQSNLLNYVKEVRPLRLDKLYFYMMENMASALGSIVFFKKTMSMREMMIECDKLCPHHVSHYLGLDVHDTPTIPRNIDLPPGVVITVEPGIYVDENNTKVRDEFKNVGFRIEDDILITESGCEVLTTGCIRNSDEIEALMKS